MQFSSLFLAASALALAAANSVHFVNQDSTQRTVVFTAQEGLEPLDDLVIEGLGTANQTFPTGWIGNWFSVSEGSAKVPGMLGEVRFDGFAGATYYDVSAIVNPDDNEGVKELFPLNESGTTSGCLTFPCTKAYYKSDDVQTQSTQDKELVCTLGNLSNERRRGLVANMIRDSASA